MHRIQQNDKSLVSQQSELPRSYSSPASLRSPRFSKSSPALMPRSSGAVEPSSSGASSRFSSSHNTLFPSKNYSNGEDDNEDIPVLSAVNVDNDDGDDVNGSAGAM